MASTLPSVSLEQINCFFTTAMRLEFEPTIAPTPPARIASFDEVSHSNSTEFQQLLQKGIAAAKNGEREDARELLMEATEMDALSEDAWMWLASISDYPEERIAFLNNVLTINPTNGRAEKWLAETESLLTDSLTETVSVQAVYDDLQPSPFHVTNAASVDLKAANYTSCLFCSYENDASAFQCNSCRAALSLSDIEALIYNPAVDSLRIKKAVAEMETEWNLDDLNDQELTALGIGHFNLRNFEAGQNYLHQLLRRDPNNVILAAQLNTIAIRLDEMNRQHEIDESKPKGKTILVVDDSATVRKLLTSKLEKSGHNVVCAVDGVDALSKIAEAMPDMVFLDITMPRKDGYEVCKEIRSNPAVKNLPIVMISGKDGFFDKVRGKMAGASGYVTKPFGPDALMKALETHLVADEPVVEQ